MIAPTNLSVEAGVIVALLGPSGYVKSVLPRVVERVVDARKRSPKKVADLGVNQSCGPPMRG
jgi:ABC-type nitrate/sulfonate/bicarbonate transport system ATPase subunit